LNEYHRSEKALPVGLKKKQGFMANIFGAIKKSYDFNSRP